MCENLNTFTTVQKYVKFEKTKLMQILVRRYPLFHKLYSYLENNRG